jgi:hypothetical protein
MEYHAAELAVPQSEASRVIELGAKSIDLTLVYNAHGTAEDADLSTAHMEPDSLVFIEGYTTQPGGQASYESDLLELNAIRLREGTECAAYIELKQDLLDDIATYDYYVPKGASDFTHNGMATLRALLNKDCLIYYADHKELKSGVGGEQARELNQAFLDSQQHIARVDLPEMRANDRIAPAITHLMRSFGGEMTAHLVREVDAAVRSLYQTGKLAESISPVPRTTEGKIPAYVMYGAAHARSLTWQFTSRGVRPTLIEVMPLSEYQYLDTVDALEYNNSRRRLGHYALRSLSYDFLEADAVKAVTEATYPHLEFLNEADPEEVKKFLITCALIKRQEVRNPADSYQWYLSTLRSFMPSPQVLAA